MKKKVILLSSVILLSACTTTSNLQLKPQLKDSQTLVGNDQIQSNINNYSVRIKKLSSEGEYKELSTYAIPFRITVANLNSKPIVFGPENIVVKINGEKVELLTVEHLENIRKQKNLKSSLSTGFVGALSFGGALLAGLAGDMSLAEENASNFGKTMENHAQKSDYTNSTISSLKDQVGSTYLATKKIDYKKANDGVVFFKKVKNARHIEVQVLTGTTYHNFTFQQ